VNQRITALAAGALPSGEKEERDVLAVGLPNNLLVYDVEQNADLFYKDVADGVGAVAVGALGRRPMVVVGGNCSLQGFDALGNEALWTVAGDHVTALCFRDVSGEGNGQLVLASQDYEMRVLQNEDVVCEVTENDVATRLTALKGRLFGYALANGTLGVYEDATRVWHAKARFEVTALSAFDMDGDGQPELVVGWSSGLLEVRRAATGEVLFHDQLGSEVAGLAVGDLRQMGSPQLVCVAADGEVRGYCAVEPEAKGGLRGAAGAAAEEALLQELSARKQKLLLELRGYETNMRELKSNKIGAGVVPPGTTLDVKVLPNEKSSCLSLSLSTNNDTVIKVVMLFCETLFEDESLVVHPPKPSAQLSVPILPAKDVQAHIHIKAVVGFRGGPQDHVFEVNYQLPRFSCYVATMGRDTPTPRSSVALRTSERVARVSLWLMQSFGLDERQVGTFSSGGSLAASFLSMRDRQPLLIKASPDGLVQLYTDNMDLAGELVTDMCAYLKVADAECVAEFPAEMEALGRVLERVEEHNKVRLQMAADVADATNALKALVIRAEDARLLGDMSRMCALYSRLHALNQELLGEYAKRANNQQELLTALKEVNLLIQKAAKLRVGKYKTALVNACRAAVKRNQLALLQKIVKVGAEGSS
jgi:Bardet-Biedl syndrome 2 protein